ncbi:hypothetical protein ASF70_15775 [Rhizobium sp. Leaf321]|nr:hypothetical protein ASF70_15775 [Rhizobium sp. Leaf321]
MGWLASTITNETKTRAQRYVEAGARLPLAPLDGGEYLLEAMRELGPIRSNGMGLTTPEWQEITAFASANGLRLAPWEYRAIRKMCSAYLSGLQSGKEPLSIPPNERAALQ